MRFWACLCLFLCGLAGCAEQDGVVLGVMDRPFVFEWEIEEQRHAVKLPLPPNFSYYFIVDWGDDTPPQAVTAYND